MPFHRLAVALLLCATSAQAQAQAPAGDCMVVGFNSDVTATRNTGYMQFGILLLTPLLQGETISVTDDGWNTAQQKFLSMSTHSSYSSTLPDSHRNYTATTTRPAGTVLTSDDFGASWKYVTGLLQRSDEGVAMSASGLPSIQ